VEFNLEEIILICEYVRVGSKSTPKTKTLDFINEYLYTKKDMKV
jgi:hypothetical protein